MLKHESNPYEMPPEVIENLTNFCIKIGLEGYNAGIQQGDVTGQNEEIKDIDRYCVQLFDNFCKGYVEGELFTEDSFLDCVEVIAKAFRAGYRKRLSPDLAKNLLLLQTTFGGVFEPVTEILERKTGKKVKSKKV